MNFLVTSLTLGILLGVIAFVLLRPQKDLQNRSFVEAKIAGETFQLEVAKSAYERARGLMNREELADDHGMLFIFPISSFYSFWMKDTLIPLDIIWLDKNKKVVFIKENAQPCKNVAEAVCSLIVSNRPAKYVVELNAGKVSELEIQVGDTFEWER